MRIGYASAGPPGTGQPLKVQVIALEAAGCSRVVVEQPDGVDRGRPALQDVLVDAQEGDTLVVAQLALLGRSVTQARGVVEVLVERGIALEALDIEIDGLSTSILTLAQWERELQQRRTRQGLERARAAGRRPGPKPKLSPEQEVAVRSAVADGESITAVAKSFGVSRPTIYRALAGRVS